MLTVTQTRQENDHKALGKVRNYNEVVAYLDALKPLEYNEKVVERMKKLDALFDNVSQKIDTILVAGTNGKSSTIHFASKLLKEEGLKVGAAYSTHFLVYSERLVSDFQLVNNKQFTDIANEVINIAEAHNIDATAFEIMTMTALLFFKAENVDVALLEVGMGGKFDATTICNPKIAAVTRVAEDYTDILGNDLDALAFEMMQVAQSDTWFISAEQSKIRLQKMKTEAESRGVLWAMPIRKLASLPYIYEQLYGRIASLGERIAQIYVEDIKQKFSPFLRGNLLATKKGARGRPTLEAKRQAELNPIKTLKGFWTEQFNLLKGRFELLDKEKPTILLDNAHNLDALTNLFLGIRLLHYAHPLKGLSIIIGLNTSVEAVEALKLVRYLLKKVTGQIFFVPLPHGEASHNPVELANIAKELNIKAKACSSFAEAMEIAKKTVDERHGVVTVTGSHAMVSEYWKQRGIKKL